MKNFILRLLYKLPWYWHDYIYAKYFIWFFDGKKVIKENEAFYVFDDGGILYKINFQDICYEKGLDYIEETYKIYQKYKDAQNCQ